MSYCRWSSDDFQCDVYVYEHVDGYIAIHVAECRPEYTEELPPPVEITDFKAYMARLEKVYDMLHRAVRNKIGLPCDGETFEIADKAEAADKLQELRDMGYKVPDYVIACLREEATDDD